MREFENPSISFFSLQLMESVEVSKEFILSSEKKVSMLTLALLRFEALRHPDQAGLLDTQAASISVEPMSNGFCHLMHSYNDLLR